MKQNAWGLLSLILPTAWVALAGPRAFGGFSVDLAGHLWMGWNASQGGVTRTELLAAPHGVDLMPVLGGWLDVWMVGLLHPALSLELAYNVVCGLYLVLAGVAGMWLARTLGARPLIAALAGLLLQVDGFVLHHLVQGRPEQVGLGFVALSVAAFLNLIRHEHVWWKAGLLGAVASLVTFVSWELTLMTVLGLAVLLPFSVRTWKSVPAGLAGATLTAGWWAALFLARTTGVRALDEGAFAMDTAHRASTGLLQWLGPGYARASWAGLAALLTVPFTAKDKRLWLGVATVLGACWLLALGPNPGLWAPGHGEPWGPFHVAQKLPVLGWFHWPDRLLAAFSVASVGAVALLGERVGKWGWIPVAAIVVAAGVEFGVPSGDYERHPAPANLWLADHAHGSVLDLPIQPNPANHLTYQMAQMDHGHPILFNMVLDHLDGGWVTETVDGDPVLAWFNTLKEPRRPTAPQWSRADFGGLVDLGYGTVVLHHHGWPPDRFDAGRAALQGALGEPGYADDQVVVWSLE